MKNLLLLLLAFGSVSIAKAQNNSQENLNKFENFIGYFQSSAQKGDSLAFISCFDTSLNTNLFNQDSLELCSRTDLLEALLNEHRFDDFSEALSSSARGFTEINTEGSLFTNAKNPLAQRKGEIHVKANQVALRRSPSLNSACIERLDVGIYSGYQRTDALEFEDEQGIMWVPIAVSVPSLGLVKCYVAGHLIDAQDQSQKYVLDVALTKRGWRITRLNVVEFTPSSLPVANL